MRGVRRRYHGPGDAVRAVRAVRVVRGPSCRALRQSQCDRPLDAMEIRRVLLAAALAVVLPALALAEPEEGNAVNVSLHAGLHYRPVFKVLATSAGMVQFNMDLTAPIARSLHEMLQDFREALVQVTPQFNETIASVSKTMELAFERMDRHFETAKLAARVAAKGAKGGKYKTRRRRSSPTYLVGDLLGWCCGFSTYEDVSVLEERDHQVLGYVEDVKHAVVQVHSEQQRHANAVNSLVKQVNAAFALDRSALSATKDNVQILRMRLTQMALSVASLASIGTDKLLNAERMYSIHAACSAGLIPMEAVRHEDLLRAAQQVLELYKGQVRVSVSDLELLYKLEIATCVFSGADRLSVVAKLPLLPANQDWHVYDVAPLGFLYHLDTGGPSVCRLLPREVMVAMSADDLHVRVMSRQQRADCLKKNLCEVPRTGEAEGVSRDCIRGVKRVFQNRNESLEALRKVCSFTCAPYRGVEVTHVENNWYSLVNMDRALVVSCPGRDYVELPPVAEGALFVEVPCQCEVLDVTDASKTRPAVLVSTVEPCHPKLSTEVSVEIKVPALWTSDQEMLAALTHQVANGSKLTTPSTSRAVSIDQDWVIKIETLSQQGPLNISALHAPALTSTRFAEASVGVLALPAWLSNLWLAALSVAVLVVHLHARCARRRAVQPVIFAPGADYNCAKK